MNKFNLLYSSLMGVVLASNAFSSLAPAISQEQNFKPATTYTWAIPTPSALVLYKNNSATPVGFIYSVDYNSDMVTIRCPLNDVTVGPNKTYICWLPQGESAKVELKAHYFRNGASGNYALLP